MIALVQWHEDDLLKMRFDGIMVFFSELQKSPFFQNKLFFCWPLTPKEREALSKEQIQVYLDENLFKKTKRIYISQELLQSLEEEYANIKKSY